MTYARETLSRTFDTVAELYDTARPSYDDALVDDLFELCGVGDPPPSILEVGCGTGQASLRLARRGGELLCVDFGENLAKIAARKLAPYPNAEVRVAKFEEVDARGRMFDIVFSICAWHWIDPAVGYAKAATVLRPGGHLAIASVSHVFPEGFDPFFAEIQVCYNAIGENADSWPTPDEVEDDSAKIDASGLFGPVRTKRIVWSIDFTAQQYVDLLETFSGHILMDASKRNWLYDQVRERIAIRPNGTIRKHHLTILHVAQVK